MVVYPVQVTRRKVKSTTVKPHYPKQGLRTMERQASFVIRHNEAVDKIDFWNILNEIVIRHEIRSAVTLRTHKDRTLLYMDVDDACKRYPVYPKLDKNVADAWRTFGIMTEQGL